MQSAEQTQKTLDRLGSRVRTIPAAISEKLEELETMFPSGTRPLTFAPHGTDGSWEPERWADRRIRHRQRIEKMKREGAEAKAILCELTRALEPVERDIILSVYVWGLTFDAIASRMKCSAKTVRRKHDRAILRIIVED